LSNETGLGKLLGFIKLGIELEFLMTGGSGWEVGKEGEDSGDKAAVYRSRFNEGIEGVDSLAVGIGIC